MKKAFLMALGVLLVFGTHTNAFAQSKVRFHAGAQDGYNLNGFEGKVELVSRRHHGGHRHSFRGHHRGGNRHSFRGHHRGGNRHSFRGHHRGGHRNSFRSHRYGGHRNSFRGHQYGYNRGHRHFNRGHRYGGHRYGYNRGYGFKGHLGGLHFYNFFRPDYYYRGYYPGSRFYRGYGYPRYNGYMSRHRGYVYGPYLYPDH